ncbi:hypothetical protein CK203_024931 [Vitis vinifera]|uniref:Uncharacterized protein n=1 Tax=Vitis vinifera TaxID=29760 RepID=A0A438J6Y5_VITVI|nr:hypothetical protein CK203_024931 [Vitis vinifera]
MVLAEVQYPITMTVILPSRTRPSGQAFFWSYAYYLSHFLHMFRTYFTILGHLIPISRNHVGHPSVLCYIRLQVLDDNRAAQYMLPVCVELPDSFIGL